MRVIVAGDYSPHGCVKTALRTQSYERMFKDVRNYIGNNCDYAIVNLECPIIKHERKSIKKVGPALYSEPEAINALKYMKFSGVTMANNHILDYGEEGLFDTISVCQEQGLDYVGVGNNTVDAQRILYKIIGNESIGIINCCEHEFSVASSDKAGANAFDILNLYYNIQEARKKTDYIIVIYHGGHEGWELPSPRMKKNFHAIIDFGADAVICHHQHCIGGTEFYLGKPIIYGLGNFCFDWKKDNRWCEGYMVNLNLNQKEINYDIIPYVQFKDEEKIQLLPSNAFDDKLAILNSIIGNDCRLRKATEDYFNGSTSWYYDFVRPFGKRLILALKSRKLLPRFYSKSWKLRLFSVINCESHREKMLYRLRKDI